MSVDSFSDYLKERFTETTQRVRASDFLLWQSLTAKQRRELGADFDTVIQDVGSAVEMWRKLHGGSQPRAIIEIALRLDHITKSTYSQLLAAIGESELTDKLSDLPYFDRDKGKLEFKGKVIRRVRIASRPTSIQKILESFQARGWPKSIKNPLTLGQHQLHETISYLNEGIKPKRLRFHGQEGGRSIYWEAT